jgi:hypothetical protein
MGQGTCDMLAEAEGGSRGSDASNGVGVDAFREQVALPSGRWSNQFLAFDRNPSRVAIGLAKQVRVVYGDGASSSLIRAAGVSEPRAIVVTYANDKRCLEATRRLRDAFPEAPIFVRARTAADAEALLQAGATEVVVEAVESVVRLATLLGAGTDAAGALLRAPLTISASSGAAGSGGSGVGGGVGGGGGGSRLPYADAELDELASECGLTRTQIGKLYDGYTMLAPNANGEVEMSAVREMLARAGKPGPIMPPELERWMRQADLDGSNTLSFFEYVRADVASAGGSGAAGRTGSLVTPS